MLLNIFINDLVEGQEGMLIKFTDDTNLGGMTNTPGDRISVQEDLNRLKNKAKTNKMSFNREICRVLHLGRKNHMQI